MQYVMYLIRNVAQRTKGMGLKIMKFHGMRHMVEDMIENGVALEFDTGANESHHKEGKQASKLTQRAATTFNYQTAIRLWEFQMLDLAKHEINTGEVIWDYFADKTNDDVSHSQSDPQNHEVGVPDPMSDTEPIKISTGEAQIKVLKDDDGEWSFRLVSKSKFKDNTSWNAALVDFLGELQDLVSDHLVENTLPIFTCHRRDGQIFRGHPNFRGKGPWKDWVWVDWGGGWGSLPCHIWCFVDMGDLMDLPTGQNSLAYGGIKLGNEVYAVVESSSLDPDKKELGRSDLMMPIYKDVEVDDNGTIDKRTFYLADTAAFERPCCVIPDIGGPTNRYFVVKPRNEWLDPFIKWLNDPHIDDHMDPFSDDESSTEEDEEVEESSTEEDEEVEEEEDSVDIDGEEDEEDEDGLDDGDER